MFPLRDENPRHIFPIVTWGMIALNVSIFIWEIFTPRAIEEIFYAYGFIPVRRIQFGMITSMFLHGDILHIAGNMLYLYIFGDNIEDACGHTRFLIFYIICGVGASILTMFLEPMSTLPVIGASGAISGVLGGYILLYPKARIRTAIFSLGFIQLVYIPAFFMIGFWFVLQILYAWIGVSTGVAYWAHIGGFVTGLVLIRPLAVRDRYVDF